MPVEEMLKELMNLPKGADVRIANLDKIVSGEETELVFEINDVMRKTEQVKVIFMN